MSQQTINVGAAPNDGTGTPLRTAFQYTNSNFTELYTAVGPSGNNIVVPGNATITGDLTVDTSTLKVDSANNRVGIGTASPALPLDVVGGIQVTSGSAGGLYQLAYGASASSRSWRAWNDVSANGDFQISTSTTRTGSTYSDRYRIDVTGIHEWFNTSGTAMTLNSTGLGVGASPSAKFHSKAGAVTLGGIIETGGANALLSFADSATSSYTRVQIGSSGNNLVALINGSTALTVDSSSNVGVGVTPTNKLTIGTGSFNSNTASGSASLYATVAQGLVVLADGFVFGTRAGVKRFDVDTSGNIISNLTSTAPTLSDNGFMVFNLTSNTNLRISVRGTDGVTRTADLTLA